MCMHAQRTHKLGDVVSIEDIDVDWPHATTRFVPSLLFALVSNTTSNVQSLSKERDLL